MREQCWALPVCETLSPSQLTISRFLFLYSCSQLRSPNQVEEKFSMDNSNLHELDGSTAEEIDLSLEVNKGGEVYGSEKEPWGDRIQADSIHQPPGSSLLPAVIRNKELESLYNRSSSPAPCELYNNNERTEDTALKEERMNSYQGDETGDTSGRHEDKLSSPVQAANIQPELEMEDPARFSSKFPLEMYSNNQLEDMKEISPHHDVSVKSNDEFPGSFQQEKTKIAHEEEEDNMQLMKKEYCDSGILMEDKNFSESVLNNGETGGRDYEVHALRENTESSTLPVRQTSSPKVSHDLPSCPQDSPYSTRSPRHRTSLSPQRISGDSRRVFLEDDLSLSPRHTSPSPTRRPQRVSPHRDEALQKRLTSPPRRRQISPDHRRPDRSVSRSPTGQRAHGRESPSPTRRPRRESFHRDEALQKRLSSPPRRQQISPDHRRSDRSVSRSPTRQRAHGSESPSPTRRPRRESLHRDEALQKRLSPPPRRRQISPDHRRSDRSVSRSPTGQRAHGRESPSPTRRPRRESLHRDGDLQKRLSSPPRRRQFSPDHQRPDRSVSRSPTGQRAHGSRRDHRVRSRSRSPFARDYYRRSPRRYSRRRRSPPRYHSHRHTPRRRPWSPPHDRNNGIGRPGNNLFVAGFNFVTTERDLERKFSRFGRVRDVRIVRDKRSGDSRGFGFLSLERDEDADAAIRALDQTEWDGRVVLVEKSKTP